MKQKTHSASKKRVKLTGSGKKLFQKAAKNHLLSSKSSRQKNFGRLGVAVHSGFTKTLSRLMQIPR